jgi:hypothetical protein
MKTETPKIVAEQLRAWAYSTSFPVGIAALIYLRVHFGYAWPFPPSVGLALLCVGLALLLADTFLGSLIHGHSQALRQQSIYSSLWACVAGVWLYSGLWGDNGLLIVITVGFPLWAFSHREVLRLKGL